jgi:hypothetical protein
MNCRKSSRALPCTALQQELLQEFGVGFETTVDTMYQTTVAVETKS